MIGLLYLHSGTPLTDFWPFSCGVELTAVSFKTSMDMTRTRPHARTHELFFLYACLGTRHWYKCSPFISDLAW